jgi:fatty acid desaturase
MDSTNLNLQLSYNKKISFAKVPKQTLNQLQSLLKHNKYIDIITIGINILIFILLIKYSHYFYTNVLFAIGFIIIQGATIHTLAQLFVHDYYTHNRLLKNFNYLIAAIVPISPTKYRKIHLNHHLYFPNSDKDPDAHTNALKTTIWSKIRTFTIIHVLHSQKNYESNCKLNNIEIYYTPKELSLIKYENLLFPLTSIIAILIMLKGSSMLIEGWFIPTILGVPIFLGIRHFAEHSYTDPEKPFGCGNNIKVPLIFKYTPFNLVLGQGHIVHHYYPSLPWYNCNKACKLLSPYIDKNNQGKFYKELIRWFSIDISTHENRQQNNISAHN